MSEARYQTHQIDDDTFYDPKFWKSGSPEMQEQYFPFIGKLVSVFNCLEEDLSDELIWYIENDRIPDAAYIIVSGLSFSSKWKLWVELLLNFLSEEIDEITPKEAKELEAIKSKIKKIGQDFERFGTIRNNIVHGIWGYINTQGLVKTKTKTNNKKQLVHDHIKIDKEQFEALITEIENFNISFVKYNKEMQKKIEGPTK